LLQLLVLALLACNIGTNFNFPRSVLFIFLENSGFSQSVSLERKSFGLGQQSTRSIFYVQSLTSVTVPNIDFLRGPRSGFCSRYRQQKDEPNTSARRPRPSTTTSIPADEGPDNRPALITFVTVTMGSALPTEVSIVPDVAEPCIRIKTPTALN
jgi:hypothetical protein